MPLPAAFLGENSFFYPSFVAQDQSFLGIKGFYGAMTYHSVVGHSISWDSVGTGYRKSSSNWLKLNRKAIGSCPRIMLASDID